MELAYYPGCSLKQSSSLYDRQMRLVMERLGVTLKELDDWNCCGATSAGKTDDFLSIAMPARNLGIAAGSGQSELVIPCSACYSRTLVAKHYLEADREIKETINLGLSKKIVSDVKVLSILEVLLGLIESGELARQLVFKPKGLRPACYYGCMLTRFPFPVPVPDDVENPRGMERILEAMDLHPLEWNCKTSCCGASSAVTDPEVSYGLMAKIIRDALARGANCLVTTCPMCQMNLDAYQDEVCAKHGISERLPTYFITEIVGVAMGMGIKPLEIDRHFVDGTKLLEELERYESEQ
ncbi:MAG: CoB--CoM heterodisulfide reductase [Desulfococcus sp. 4484_241]|nr:MAG: CoB--CoM heterodisulfide reductase [Desulfococcus sp. 4484_241]